MKIIILIILTIILFLTNPLETTLSNNSNVNKLPCHSHVNRLPVADDQFHIKAYIRLESIKHNIDPLTAYRIAKCESEFNPKAKNKNSTASGIYQYVLGTWTNYCKGDVFNAKDNIDCFMIIFPKHPTWWECY